MFSAELCNELSKNHQITILTSGRCSEHTALLDARVTQISCPIPKLRPFRFLIFLRSILQLRRIIREQNPDIIWTNSVRAGIFGVFFSHPWVHFAHDYTFPKFLSVLLRRAQHICTCSNSVSRDLQAKGVSASKTTTVYGGIFPKYKNKKKNDNITTAPRIAIVGRLDSWKGQDVFLRMAKQLKHVIPKAEYFIYGSASAHDPKTRYILWTSGHRRDCKKNRHSYSRQHTERAFWESYP